MYVIIVEHSDRQAAYGVYEVVSAGLQAMKSTLRTWRERARMRRELAQIDARMLQDVGIPVAMGEYEASKPFWRPEQSLRG